jgi:ABC-type transporter MlaC component
MNVSRRSFMLALASMMVPVGMVADVWAESPADQLRRQIDRVVRVLADPDLKAAGRERERQAAVSKIAEEILDFAEMTRRTLGPHWQGRTEPERAKITRLFSDLLGRVYFTKIAAYNGEKITVFKDSVDGEQATVRTRIVTAFEFQADAVRLGLDGDFQHVRSAGSGYASAMPSVSLRRSVRNSSP